MGVEPTDDTERCRPPVLKTGRVTGPHALPCVILKEVRTRCENPASPRLASKERTRTWVTAAIYFGCGTIRMYGLGALQPPGYF